MDQFKYLNRNHMGFPMLKYLRQLLGWKDPINIPQESCVIVCGHTSYWDAFISILYSEDLQT